MKINRPSKNLMRLGDVPGGTLFSIANPIFEEEAYNIYLRAFHPDDTRMSLKYCVNIENSQMVLFSQSTEVIIYDATIDLKEKEINK